MLGMTQTTALDPDTIQPLHEVTDEAKLAELAQSMRRDGWTGAPIVVATREWGPDACTGSHRIVAAREAGIDVPAVELADLFAREGHNLNVELADYEAAGLSLYDLLVRIADYLPADVIAEHGIDAH